VENGSTTFILQAFVRIAFVLTTCNPTQFGHSDRYFSRYKIVIYNKSYSNKSHMKIIFFTKFISTKVVGTKFVSTKFVSTKFVSTKFVSTKFVCPKFVSTKFVSTKFVSTKFVSKKFVSKKFVSTKFVSTKFVSTKFVSTTFVSTKFVTAIRTKFCMNSILVNTYKFCTRAFPLTRSLSNFFKHTLHFLSLPFCFNKALLLQLLIKLSPLLKWPNF
jgi:hypothetical protein